MKGGKKYSNCWNLNVPPGHFCVQVYFLTAVLVKCLKAVIYNFILNGILLKAIRNHQNTDYTIGLK